MSKPNSIYMWDNVEKNIQRIESQIDLMNKTTNYMIPNIVPKKKILHSNHLILLENLCE